MLGTQHFSLFLTSAVLLNLTPGQDTMYILGRGIGQGRRAAIVSALGISSGCVVHTLTAALGLSAVLAQSAVAFQTIKWAGALYLVYLGVRMLASSNRLIIKSPTGAADLWAVYRQAVLTNVLNPKVALFFLAFLPQFVDPATAHRLVPFLFLGGCFIGTGTCWCLVLASASGTLGSAVGRYDRAAALLEKLAGGMFVLLGLRLAISGRR